MVTLVRLHCCALLPLSFLLQGCFGAGGERYQSGLSQANSKHIKEVKQVVKLAKEECADGSCAEDTQAAQRLLSLNIAVSDRVPLSRDLPDYRYQPCVDKAPSYKSAGSVSVVLVFYNEATSTLLRTAQSVLDRTAAETLKEVLLISDGVTQGPWRERQRAAITEYCAKNPKVRHVQLPEHLGLAPAKARGAKEATGDLLVFLDSHCEVGTGWLEPLADAVARDRRTVAIPIIDGIDAENFAYRPGARPTRGVFTWGMYYAGEPYSEGEQRDIQEGKNVGMPIMPGGLFLVERAWFEELGFYDEGLRIWGAENIELSLKVWRCGGRVELVPCSRVGHVYKNVGHQFPPGESLHKNFKRIAEVWLDKYKEFYYNSFPGAKMLDAGDLGQALASRERLTCKSMDWFLENVYPTMFVPKNYLHQGLLQRAGAKQGCVDLRRVALASNPMQEPHVSEVGLETCGVSSDYNQWYHMNDTKRIVHIGIWIEECLGVKSFLGHQAKEALPVVACQCAKYDQGGCTKEEIEWEYTDTGLLRHVATGRCVVALKKGKIRALKDCTPNSASTWRFKDRWTPDGEARNEL